MPLPTVEPFYITPPDLTASNWRSRAAAKRAARDALIPAEWRLDEAVLAPANRDATTVVAGCGLLSEREMEITELDELKELAARIAHGEYTSVEVTTAYCKRAAVAQQLTNCLTEIYFEQALERARQLDQQLLTTGKLAGPLHGVPISLKDQFDIKGTELTMGYASYLGRISPQNSALVSLLLDAGAVLHCRTNIPTTLLDGDTENNIFGRTLNPLNLKLSPGGSSGGEGALVAMKGSILGVGTDIGGSIRIPASFCGLHALRPSSHRVPYGVAANSLLGQQSVVSTAGPLARSFSSCAYFLKTVFEAQPAEYDATALPLPFDSTARERVKGREKLAFGVVRTDGWVRPHPPVRRGLEEAVRKLREAGHEVLEFDMTEFKGISPLLTAILLADGGDDIRMTLSPIEEPLLPHQSFPPTTRCTVYETYQLNRQKETYQQRFLQRWLSTSSETTTGKPIDALLLPTTAETACRRLSWGGFGAIASLLDLPAACFPVARVEPEVDRREEEGGFVSLGKEDDDVRANYDPILMAGMPVSLQIIGRRWKDEELLAVASRVAQIVNRA
ncbi:hypothetical protein JCM8547_000521 [Rhodosporidiobolus lusitaniae]